MPANDAKGPILIVEDDAHVREAIKDTLEEEGYTTVEAGDGAEALQYLRENPAPSLILIDWNMAPMNAPAFMEEFAKHPLASQIPVILLTADGRAEEKSRSGYVGYLKKPVKLDEFLELVSRHCAERDERRR
jgi:CheY-like chemotaxis protein